MSRAGPGSRRRAGRVFRLLALNAVGAALGIAAIGAAAELALRFSTPFMAPHRPQVFRPGVGFLLQPSAEVRATNGLDFWTTDRVNRLGFRDREPPTPERAAATCHLAVIGDSFVEAKQVPLADRLHLRLEELAARELPALDLTTSAWGMGNTGQVQQLAFYDEFVRPLRPKVVALLFHPHDLPDNSALLRAALFGWDPERPPEPSAVRGPDGAFAWRPPLDREFEAARAPGARRRPRSWMGHSWFGHWLLAKRWTFRQGGARNAAMISRLDALRRRPEYAELLHDYRPQNRHEVMLGFARPDLAPVLEDALDSTAFALRRFRERADEIGAALVGLAVHSFDSMQARADRETGDSRRRPPPPAAERRASRNLLLDRTRSRASAAGIPVLDLGAEIRRRGMNPAEVRWPHDDHWNAAGHRLAAEMLLRWLQDNRSVCDGPRREEVGTTGASARAPGAAEKGLRAAAPGAAPHRAR